MKKMTKLLAALLCTAVLFTACQNGATGTDSGTNGGTDAGGADAAASTAEDAADPSSIPLPSQGNIAVEKAADRPITIAFLAFQNNPFWDQINEGREAVTKYMKNFNCTVDYTVIGDDLSAEKVNAAIDAAILKEVDAIVVSSFADGTEAYINKAVDAGIPVCTIIGESTNPGKRFAFVGQDTIGAAQEAAGLIGEYMQGEGSVGIITGNFSTVQHEQRRYGMEDKLKELYPDIKFAATVEANDSTEKTYSAAKDMITANEDLKVIYCTAGGPYGAAQAVQEMGKTGEIGVVCYDWVPDNVKYVKTGEIIAALSQDPQGMGFDSVVMCYNHLVTGWVPESGDGFSPVTQDILTPENLAEKLPDQA